MFFRQLKLEWGAGARLAAAEADLTAATLALHYHCVQDGQVIPAHTQISKLLSGCQCCAVCIYIKQKTIWVQTINT